MADKNTDKDALKAAKDAEKAAKKAKQERIKSSKPKKEGTVFSRAGRSVKKFFKDFSGTCKKIIWPGAAQVFKSSAIVLASIVVVGLIIYGIDQGLTSLFDLGKNSVIELAEAVSPDETTTAADETTTSAATATTAASGAEADTTGAQETTSAEEGTTAEESTAAQ